MKIDDAIGRLEDVSFLRNSKGQIYLWVGYDRKIEATTDVWVGDFETHQNFKLGLELVLQNIGRFKSIKWLAYLSRMERGFEDLKEWIAQSVIPRAISMGLQFEALVLPMNIFALLSVQETMMTAEGLQIRLFGNVDDAIGWLEECGRY
jgi:hypothetical protein